MQCIHWHNTARLLRFALSCRTCMHRCVAKRRWTFSRFNWKFIHWWGQMNRRLNKTRNGCSTVHTCTNKQTKQYIPTSPSMFVRKTHALHLFIPQTQLADGVLTCLLKDWSVPSAFSWWQSSLPVASHIQAIQVGLPVGRVASQ